MHRIDEARRRAYAETNYEVKGPNGCVIFRVDRAPAGDISFLHGRPLAVVTAYNPGMHTRTDHENRDANERLRTLIEIGGWEHYDARGVSHDGSYAEPSFGVMGISSPEARDLAARFDQAAIYYWDGSAGRIEWCS